MAKPNGFMLFVNERKNSDRRNNLPVQGDAVYGAEWANLSAEEKRRYKERAQGRNAAANGHVASAPAGALSADSVTGQYMEAESGDNEDKETYQLVQALVTEDQTAAANLKVVIAASNVMVKTSEGKFFPMEIGLVKYSLTEGAVGKYQQFTDPGEIPSGYMFKARTHCESTHRIPNPFEKAIGKRNRQQEFESMMDEISIFTDDCKFQYKGKTFILMFTTEIMVDQLTGSIESFLADSKHPQFSAMWNEKRFRVVDISILIHLLYAACGVQMPLPLCADIPNSTTYDWTPGSCEWHTAADNNDCALGVCMRWCYLISDTLLPPYDMDPIPGKHLPVMDQSGIHVEEAPDEVWNVARDRRSVRPFMTPSVNGNAPPAPVSASGATSQAHGSENDPRLREFEPPGSRPADPRLNGSFGRGMRRH